MHARQACSPLQLRTPGRLHVELVEELGVDQRQEHHLLERAHVLRQAADLRRHRRVRPTGRAVRPAGWLGAGSPGRSRRLRRPTRARPTWSKPSEGSTTRGVISALLAFSRASPTAASCRVNGAASRPPPPPPCAAAWRGVCGSMPEGPLWRGDRNAGGAYGRAPVLSATGKAAASGPRAAVMQRELRRQQPHTTAVCQVVPCAASRSSSSLRGAARRPPPKLRCRGAPLWRPDLSRERPVSSMRLRRFLRRRAGRPRGGGGGRAPSGCLAGLSPWWRPALPGCVPPAAASCAQPPSRHLLAPHLGASPGPALAPGGGGGFLMVTSSRSRSL
jgi:hypothetical protein